MTANDRYNTFYNAALNYAKLLKPEQLEGLTVEQYANLEAINQLNKLPKLLKAVESFKH